MSTITINLDGVIEANLQISSMKSKVSNAKLGTSSLSYQIDNKIQNRRNIYNQIRSLSNILGNIESDIAKLDMVTASAATEYRNTDDILAGRKIEYMSFFNGSVSSGEGKIAAAASLFMIENESSSWNILGGEFESEQHKTTLTGYAAKYENEKGTSAYILKTELAAKDELSSGFDVKSASDSADDYLKRNGYQVESDKIRGEYNPTTGKWEASDTGLTNAKTQATLLEKSVSVTASVSLLEGTIKGDNGWANGSASAKLLNAEANANASAGFYAVDKDGKTLFSPGVSAKVSASVSLFEAEANGQIGNDMIGVNGKGAVSVLTAEAKAEAGLGMVDGEFEAKVNVGAEAILAEAKGDVGLNVLGGEVGVSGGVNFGIGANADAGYADGKLKCDFGLSVGVGVSVGVEIDVGGMVDTVSGAAQSVMDGAGDLWESVF